MGLTKPDSGWSWVVMLAVFGITFTAGYLQWTGGMIRLMFMEKFQASSLQTSWISAIFLSLISFAGPVASLLIDKFNCRLSMVVGATMLSSGLFLTAFVDKLIFVFLTFGILAGTGLGIVYNTGLIFLAMNFKRKLNIASGIASSGAGVGPFILTHIFQMIFETYGYTGFFLLLGGLGLQSFVFATIFRKTEIEAKVKISKANKNVNLQQSLLSYLEIVKNPSIICICLSMLLLNISIYLVYIHFPEYCMLTGSSKTDVSIFLSSSGISSCVVRILFGLANNSESIDEIIMLFGTYSLLGVATILFPMLSFSFLTKLIYSCMLGGYSGCCWSVLNAILIEILGHTKLAHGIGYIMLYVAVGTFVGPPLAGLIINNGGTYSESFTLAGVLFIGGALFCLFSKTCQAKETKSCSVLDNMEFDVKFITTKNDSCVDENTKLQPL